MRGIAFGPECSVYCLSASDSSFPYLTGDQQDSLGDRSSVGLEGEVIRSDT